MLEIKFLQINKIEFKLCQIHFGEFRNNLKKYSKKNKIFGNGN